MKKKIFATVLCMVTAVSMLTGCGGTSSDTPKDNEPVMESEAVQTTDEATDNTTVSDTEAESESEDTSTEVSAEKINLYDYNLAFNPDAKDADGNTLGDATKNLVTSIALYNCNGEIPLSWNTVLEYVDIDGEQWVQATFTFNDDSYDYGGHLINYVESPFVIAVSPDKNKVLYKDVVYTVPEQ